MQGRKMEEEGGGGEVRDKAPPIAAIAALGQGGFYIILLDDIA
jgi:hypothetical protein